MSLHEKPLVSIVTPVYNGQDFIAECIESVLKQTYSNWEYIILNNCSTDQSLAIAHKYAEKDDRIQVIDNSTFLDQLPNWNKALRQISSQSRYCKLIQADDWIYPTCLEKMIAIGEAHPSVGLISSYRLEENKLSGAGLSYQTNFLTGKDTAREVLMNSTNLFGSASSVMYRSDLVLGEQVFFDESIVHADTDACFRILQDHDFGYVHQVLTFTRRHNEAATNFCIYYETYCLMDLIVLKRYGRNFLTSEELDIQMNRKLFSQHRKYLKFILLNRTDAMQYHKKELRKLNLQLNWSLLIKAFIYQLYYFKDFIDFFRNQETVDSVKTDKKRNIVHINSKKSDAKSDKITV